MQFIPRPEAERLCRAIRFHHKIAQEKFAHYWDKLMWELFGLCRHPHSKEGDWQDQLLTEEEKEKLSAKFNQQQR